MATHLIAAADPARTADPRGPWLRLSAAMTEQVADLADRDDLAVTCAPGAGRGSPGCFIPALATVELDGTHLGHDPATCDPSRPSDRDRYPALWGVLVHEAAHARHSRWQALDGTPAACVEAAMTLEESRIEAAHLRRRPADRRWLRAAAHQLVLADFISPTAAAPPVTATEPSGSDPSVTGVSQESGPSAGPATAHPGAPCAPMTPWTAARAAALLLARVDAGTLDRDETVALAATVTTVLGASRLSALAALWHIAHTTGDDDQEAMLDLGRRWCRIIGTDPDQPAPDAAEGTPGESGSPGGPSPLAEAITTTLTAVAESGAPGVTAGPDRARQRHEEKAARQRAERAARRVFNGDGTHTDTGRRGPTAITGSRPPRKDEQAAARQLARILRAAAHRERLTTTTTSATPPGRLRMRGALAADAQRAAGATPSAEPFTRATRRHVPAPPLRVGIACDVSGSMYAVAAPVASAAWILARAAAHVPDAHAATVIFGAKVRPITHPGRTPTHVREFTARDSTEQFTEAIDALDAALDLTHPGAARLLVIVSDGIFTPEQRTLGQQRITRLTNAGCAVLWLALERPAFPMKGTHLVMLPDPSAAAITIGQAATRALRHT